MDIWCYQQITTCFCCDYNLLIGKSDDREEQRVTEIAHLLIHSSSVHRSRTQELHLSFPSHTNSRNPNTWATNDYVPGCLSRKLYWKSRGIWLHELAHGVAGVPGHGVALCVTTQNFEDQMSILISWNINTTVGIVWCLIFSSWFVSFALLKTLLMIYLLCLS